VVRGIIGDEFFRLFTATELSLCELQVAGALSAVYALEGVTMTVEHYTHDILQEINDGAAKYIKLDLLGFDAARLTVPDGEDYFLPSLAESRLRASLIFFKSEKATGVPEEEREAYKIAAKISKCVALYLMGGHSHEDVRLIITALHTRLRLIATPKVES